MTRGSDVISRWSDRAVSHQRNYRLSGASTRPLYSTTVAVQEVTEGVAARQDRLGRADCARAEVADMMEVSEMMQVCLLRDLQIRFAEYREHLAHRFGHTPCASLRLTVISCTSWDGVCRGWPLAVNVVVRVSWDQRSLLNTVFAHGFGAAVCPDTQHTRRHPAKAPVRTSLGLRTGCLSLCVMRTFFVFMRASAGCDPRQQTRLRRVAAAKQAQAQFRTRRKWRVPVRTSPRRAFCERAACAPQPQKNKTHRHTIGQAGVGAPRAAFFFFSAVVRARVRWHYFIANMLHFELLMSALFVCFCCCCLGHC